MERLLVFLFSVTLLLATSPPRETNEACDYSGGICTVKERCSAKPSRSKDQAAIAKASAESKQPAFAKASAESKQPAFAKASAESKQPAFAKASAGKEDNGDCGKNSSCPLSSCCVSGPCCCLCIVPERPVLHIAPPMPEEERIKPSEYQDFLPQQVYHTIWKPPAFSV